MPEIDVLAVTIVTATKLCAVSPRTIQNYIAANKLLPSRKIGRRRLVLVADLQEFLRRDQPSLSPATRTDKPSPAAEGLRT